MSFWTVNGSESRTKISSGSHMDIEGDVQLSIRKRLLLGRQRDRSLSSCSHREARCKILKVLRTLISTSLVVEEA